MKIKNVLRASECLIKTYLGMKAPLSVNFSITNKCNFQCEYCGIWKIKKKEMSTSQIISLIDDLAKVGVQRINILGGEPLLRKDIKRVIDYVKRKHLIVSISSNGMLLPLRIEEIQKVDNLLLTFDGPKKLQNKLKGDGSYENLMEGIKMCKEMRVNVGTMTVLTNKNLKYVDFILKKAKKLGFLAYFQLLMHNPPISGRTKKFVASKEKYRRCIKKIIIKKKKGYPVGNSFPYLIHIFNWPDYRKTVLNINALNKKKKVRCWAGKLFCNIECDGNIFPCLPKVGKSKPENFLDVGFKKAFYSINQKNRNDCWCYVNLESNIIFSLNFSAILNVLNKL